MLKQDVELFNSTTTMRQMNIKNLIRKNILELTPYSTARDDCKIPMEVYLDANENPFDNGVNRYPSPRQEDLKRTISTIKKIPVKNLFLGNGSDEAIDLVYRVFCEPGKSSAIIMNPSYGMYSVAAQMNDVKIIDAFLTTDTFQIDAEKLLGQVRKDTRVIFLCSPNNPTGNLLDTKSIEKILKSFKGIVVVDQAYFDFAICKSPAGARRITDFKKNIAKYPNLIVLETLSKAYAMAGLRIGLAIANEDIINIFNNVKYPYNINILAQRQALQMLRSSLKKEEEVETIVSERERVAEELKEIGKGKTDGVVQKVYPSDANFLLVKFRQKDKIFNLLQENKIIVRDRGNMHGCKDCLRITIGTQVENERMLRCIKAFAGALNSNTHTNAKKTGTEQIEIERIGSERIAPERVASVERFTKETQIQVYANLDKFREPRIETPLNFLNHMLQQIGYHGGITLDIKASGDIKVDEHHTVEDIAITLGECLKKALGNKKGIERYGFCLPMDEADAYMAMDMGGRIDFRWDVKFKSEKIGDVNSQMFEHFFKSLAEHLECNLHIKASGSNDHHVVEGIFKAFARTLKSAVRRETRDFAIPSSKGVL
jgi:histidinol-phosphate aminotransferase